MSELELLRNELTDDQRKILTTVWNYFHERKKWIPARVLHRGDMAKVWQALNKLGGKIVWEYEDSVGKYYELSFLGILLTEEGPNFEQLLARYLAYLAQKCIEEPGRIQLSSQEIETDMGLDPDQVALLGYLVNIGKFFYRSGGGRLTYEWGTDIPEEVEEFPEDLVKYVHNRAMKYYDPNAPVAAAEQWAYHSSKMSKEFQKEAQPEPAGTSTRDVYVDESRIAELRAITSSKHDLTRLIKLCEELNICYSNECYLAVAMLTRAILDHVPPIFGASDFSQIKGNRSFQNSMRHLDKSCRNIADAHLHTHIRPKEVLPTKTQVNFSNDLDVLLAEIVTIL